jgi:hypothetical protein
MAEKVAFGDFGCVAAGFCGAERDAGGAWIHWLRGDAAGFREAWMRPLEAGPAGDFTGGGIRRTLCVGTCSCDVPDATGNEVLVCSGRALIHLWGLIENVAVGRGPGWHDRGAYRQSTPFVFRRRVGGVRDRGPVPRRHRLTSTGAIPPQTYDHGVAAEILPQSDTTSQRSS